MNRLSCKIRSPHLKRQGVETGFYHSHRHIEKKIMIFKIYDFFGTQLAEMFKGSIHLCFRRVLLSRYKKLTYYLLLGPARYNILSF
jgi:hypothetical protein